MPVHELYKLDKKKTSKKSPVIVVDKKKIFLCGIIEKKNVSYFFPDKIVILEDDRKGCLSFNT